MTVIRSSSYFDILPLCNVIFPSDHIKISRLPNTTRVEARSASTFAFTATTFIAVSSAARYNVHEFYSHIDCILLDSATMFGELRPTTVPELELNSHALVQITEHE